MVTILIFLSLCVLANCQFYPILPGGIGSSADCFASFPNLKERFSTEQLEFFCQQKRIYDSIVFNETLEPFTEPQLEFLNSLKIDTNSFVEPAVRVEIRALSDAQLRTLYQALNMLKDDLIDGVSKYDLIAMLLHPALSPGARVGAAFLPWHREYLRTMEAALKQARGSVSIPYWDSTLDENLESPLDSIVWTEKYFGNAFGDVITGPFANWTFSSSNDTDGLKLTRSVGQSGSMFDERLRSFVLSRQKLKELTACVDLTLETASNRLLEYIGGSSSNIYYASQDPIYFFHHAYLDMLFEEFRQNRTDEERIYGYPMNYEACSQYHYGRASMQPFGPNLSNLDGLSDMYSDAIKYDSGLCDGHGTFSDANGTCVSQVQAGGDCGRFAASPRVCYMSSCVSGVCSHNGSPSPPGPPGGMSPPVGSTPVPVQTRQEDTIGRNEVTSEMHGPTPPPHTSTGRPSADSSTGDSTNSEENSVSS